MASGCSTRWSVGFAGEQKGHRRHSLRSGSSRGTILGEGLQELWKAEWPTAGRAVSPLSPWHSWHTRMSLFTAKVQICSREGELVIKLRGKSQETLNIRLNLMWQWPNGNLTGSWASGYTSIKVLWKSNCQQKKLLPSEILGHCNKETLWKTQRSKTAAKTRVRLKIRTFQLFCILRRITDLKLSDKVWRNITFLEEMRDCSCFDHRMLLLALDIPQSYNQAKIRWEKRSKVTDKMIPAKFDFLVHWDSLWPVCATSGSLCHSSVCTGLSLSPAGY